MAISNSIGSNIFDLLFCLGLPWFFTTLIVSPGSIVKINSAGISYWSGILLVSIVILISCFIISKWKIERKVGITLFFFWLLATIFMCLLEFDVFGKFSLPNC